MDQLFREVSKQVGTEHEGVVAFWSTNKINPNGIAQKRVIAISDFNVFVFKTKFLSSSLTLCRKYHLCTVKSMVHDPERGAVVDFEEGTINIKDPEVEDKFLKTISKQLCVFLTDDEFPVKIQRTSNIDPVLRLHYFMDKYQKFDQAVLSTLTSFVNSKATTIVLSQFSGKVDALLPYLCFIQTVHKLVIDIPINAETAEYLTEYFNHVNCITEIVFQSKIRVDIGPIISNCQAAVKTVSFIDTNEGDFISKTILAILKQFSLNSLVLQNSLTIEIANAIAEYGKKSDPREMLITEASNDILLKVLPSFPGTKNFIIEKPKDNIIEFFNNFTTSSITLDSFEFKDCKILSNFDLSKMSRIIKSIKISNCVVNEEGIKFAAKAAQNRIYSISGIRLQEGCDEKKAVQGFKESISNQSSFLRWDDSFFNADMFNFIAPLQLDELILRDIFTNESLLIKDVCKLIKETNIIRILDISITDSKKSIKTAELHELIKSLEENQSIESFSFNEFVITKETLDLILSLLKTNKIITQLQFGYEGIDSQALIDFFKSIVPKSQPVKFFLRGKDRKNSEFSQEVIDAWKTAENTKPGRKKF